MTPPRLLSSAGDLYADPRWTDGVDTDRNAFVDDLFGWNFRSAADEPNAPNDPQDLLGHGTHVAGTIGAIGNNNRGVTGATISRSYKNFGYITE